MRRGIFLLGLLLVIAVFTACATSSSSSPVEGTLTIPNGLGFGGSDDGIVVAFVRVTNDSRCAAGVQCVRAGEAFVTIKTIVDGGTPEESTLEMGPGAPPTLVVDRFTITLLELRPSPPPVGGVAQDQYELLLRIEKADS